MQRGHTGARSAGRGARPRKATTNRIRAAAVLVVAGGLVAYGLQSAEAAPEKLLQSVDVKLADDGAVTSISSTTITQDDDGSSKDDDQDHDPSKVGGDLPIRVLTSYHLGKKSGTDLNDLKGKKGRVRIDVTVQNTTVRPQLLTYDSNAVSKTAPALVGTPLTVVASADLGKADLSEVVATDPDSDADTATTNGVVSRGDDGHSRVQWATMLAPPRLAASATFTLVQDTTNFTPPTFDVSVQPGLVTDTSVSRLVDSAFGSDNGTQELTSRTITLLGSVGTVLTDASTVLAKVEKQLDGSADELGTKTISDLRSSSSYVTSALGGLSSDLDSLQTTMESSLDSARGKAVEQLASSLQQVQDKVLGDPDDVDTKPLPTPKPTADCQLPKTDLGSSSTVYGQLRAVQSQLSQLATATGSCKSVIVGSLRATLGEDTDTCRDATALGSLTCAGAALDATASNLTAVKTSVDETFDETLLGKTATSLSTVLTGLDNAQERAQGLGTGSIKDGLEDLRSNLEDVKTSLGTVGPTLTTINQRAATQLDLISGVFGAVTQADQLAVIVCTQIPEGIQRDAAIHLLNGADCGMPAAADETTSLRGKLTASSDAWTEVQQLTGTTGDTALGTIVSNIDDTVDDMLGQVDDILDGSVGGLEIRVAGLVDELQKLYTPIPVPPVDDVPQPDLPAPRTALGTSFAELKKNQEGVTETLDSTFSGLQAALQEPKNKISASKEKVKDVRDSSADDAGGLFDGFSSYLNGVGDAIVKQGGASISKQRDQLDDESAAFGSTLGGTVSKALKQIDSQVGSSNRDLESSETDLVGDLKAILVNIGQPDKNGSGLLGAIYTGARRTGASSTKIVDAGKVSDAFSRVRGATLDDLYLQQAQVTASLEAEAAFPAFDLKVPDGSSVRTVFSFHIGKD